MNCDDLRPDYGAFGSESRRIPNSRKFWAHLIVAARSAWRRRSAIATVRNVAAVKPQVPSKHLRNGWWLWVSSMPERRGQCVVSLGALGGAGDSCWFPFRFRKTSGDGDPALLRARFNEVLSIPE